VPVPLLVAYSGGVVTSPVELDEPRSAEEVDVAHPWVTLVWNDPVNLMSYVTYVFQSYFGYGRAKAERLMLDVHHKGRAAVAHGAREEMERHVEALQGYGLWATMQKDD
jgi:ATP-dependent Clp protease adaptor protein ClpS